MTAQQSFLQSTSKLLFFSKFWVSSLIELRKRKPGFDSKISQNWKHIYSLTKLISAHDSIILVHFNLVHCSFIFGHGWLHSNQFGKTCQNGFCPSWHCLWCMMAFAGAFTTKQQLLLMHPHCFVYYDKTWMKRVLTCFTKIIAERPSLSQYERPMYHNERKINMLSSTDNNFMICIFDFERFSIESRFPILKLTLSLYTQFSSL